MRSLRIQADLPLTLLFLKIFCKGEYFRKRVSKSSSACSKLSFEPSTTCVCVDLILCTSSVRKVSKCRFGGQFKHIPVCQKKFRLHFWNPCPFICLFDKISMHCWRRLLGVIFIWKQKVKNDMCHFASFSWIVAAKYAEVIFFALQIIGKSNNQGVAAN